VAVTAGDDAMNRCTATLLGRPREDESNCTDQSASAGICVACKTSRAYARCSHVHDHVGLLDRVTGGPFTERVQLHKLRQRIARKTGQPLIHVKYEVASLNKQFHGELGLPVRDFGIVQVRKDVLRSTLLQLFVRLERQRATDHDNPRRGTELLGRLL